MPCLGDSRLCEVDYQILISQLHYVATEAKIRAVRDLESERVEQVKYGSALNEQLIESRAQSLEAKQDLLTTELRLSDLTMQLNDVMGLPVTTELGARLTWDLFDGGRRGVVGESKALLAQAKENLDRVTEEVQLGVEVAFNRIARTREMVNVAEQVLALRVESNRVLAEELHKGTALPSQADAAVAQESEARTQLLQSQLDYIQAQDEMIKAMGKTPE
jgi:outer membrane protein TolC